MGNDGGTIAKRQDLFALHTQKPSECLEDDLLDICATSFLPLEDPVVSDYKGLLYRKDKLIEHILASKQTATDKKQQGPNLDHISSLKDVIDLRIAWKNKHITCPVTETVRTIKVPFAYLRPCGCLMLLKLLEKVQGTLKEKKIQKENCPCCGTEFHFDYDVVVVESQKEKEARDRNEKNHEYVSRVLRQYHNGKRMSKGQKRGRESEDKKGNAIQTKEGTQSKIATKIPTKSEAKAQNRNAPSTDSKQSTSLEDSAQNCTTTNSTPPSPPSQPTSKKTKV